MNSFKCPQCGLVNWATVETCKRCGVQFANVSQPASQASEMEGGQEVQGAHAGWQGDSQGASYSSHYKVGPQSAREDGPRAFYYAAEEVKKRTGLAITSLVLGILGFFTFGVLGLGALVGTISGIVALSKAKKYPSEYGGEGLAIGGIVTNVLSLLLVVPLGIIMAIAIPNLLASRRAANETYTIRMLGVIAEAESVYQSTTGHGDYGTLEDLRRVQLMDESLATGTKYGYRFEARIKTMTPGTPSASYEVVATPVSYGNSGTRSFFLDDSGVIRAANKRGMEASANDPPFSNNTPYPGEYRETRQVFYPH